MGRSSGNAATEQFVALMQRSNQLLDLNLLQLLDISQHHIRPLLSRVGHDPLDIICGYAGFHSSYMNIISNFASKYSVDPRSLIIELCKITQSEAPSSVVEELAIKLKKLNLKSSDDDYRSLDYYFGNEQS